MTWKQVFELYDNNFERIRGILSTFGSNFYTETFTNLTSDIINLESSYVPGRNSLMVFVNGVIQWEGDG